MDSRADGQQDGWAVERINITLTSYLRYNVDPLYCIFSQVGQAHFVGQMGTFCIGRMGTFCRSDGHFLQVGWAFFRRSDGHFCKQYGHCLQVGCALLCRQDGHIDQFKLFSTKAVRILYQFRVRTQVKIVSGPSAAARTRMRSLQRRLYGI